MRPKEFVRFLSGYKFENVFNPYLDRCMVHDLNDAPARRSHALLDLLEAAAKVQLDALWIGRDLGYRGGRRTGLALTDDVHLTIHATRWNVSIQRATTGSMVAERTAGIIWSMLNRVSSPIFLWNVFPFHPHEANDPFSNRSHRPCERTIGEELLTELIKILRPRRLVALGNDAAKIATRLAGSGKVIKVRHPSYGGQRDFIKQIQSLYSIQVNTKRLSSASVLS
jgi:hypothetical protein